MAHDPDGPDFADFMRKIFNLKLPE
jgi:hypothetical protein